jgi:uncharacterized protein YeaO (DUF488 family)
VIKVKSVYDARHADDGYRILIEPEWPRGAPKGKRAGCDWIKSLGPSANLRGWMRRNPRKASGFRDRYLAELGHNERDVDRVEALLKQYRTVTILHAPADDDWDIAETLAGYLRARCDVG